MSEVYLVYMKDYLIDVAYWFFEEDKSLEAKFYVSFVLLMLIAFLSLPFSYGFGLFLTVLWSIYTGFMFIGHNTFTKSVSLSFVLAIPAYLLGGVALASLIFLGAMIFFLR